MWWLKTAIQIVVQNVGNFFKPKDERKWGFDLGGSKKFALPEKMSIDGVYLGIDRVFYPLVRPLQTLAIINKKAAQFGFSGADLSKYEYVSTNDAGEKLYRAKDYVKPMDIADQKRIDDANKPAVVVQSPSVFVASPVAKYGTSNLLPESVPLVLRTNENVKPAVNPSLSFSVPVVAVFVAFLGFLAYREIK